MGTQGNWTREWPAKPGMYWFWGHRFGSSPPTYSFVRAARNATGGIMLSGDGFFWNKAEKHDGWWMPARTPEPPKEGK